MRQAARHYQSRPPQSAGPAPRPQRPVMSVVVPVYNEQDSVGLFVDTIKPVLDGLDCEHEIVFVNDGSRDGTLAALIGRARSDGAIRVVDLSRNFGKEAAMTAGLDIARGDVIVPMDVDLQDPPELLADFLREWRAGHDVVYGVRVSRAADSWLKRATAGLFYRLFNAVSPTPIPENAGDFRLMDRRVVEVLKTLPERTRFMKGLFGWVGFDAVGVPYERPERAEGTTKWNYRKLFNFAIDGLVGFSSLPLKVWSYVGAVVAALAFVHGLFIVGSTLVSGVAVPGYASLMTVVLFLGGIQLITLGVLGEYVARMFVELKQRPVYVLDTVYEQANAPAWMSRREGDGA